MLCILPLLITTIYSLSLSVFKACFYLDPYSRPETKRGGAWMNEFRTREKLSDGTIKHPMAVLVCNQSIPVSDNPSLMRFGEVTTLFHEFGHTLQHMLTTVDLPQVSGINGIEWDAVEIASQFMENWCYDKQTLKSLSEHIDTKEELPEQLFTKIINAKKYAPAPLLADDQFLCSFSHIFGGGYSAGYFSYKWSEVLSADAFAAFEEAGLDNEAAIKATGLRLRATIMALGGGTPPMDAFKAFRGREPSTAALLRHCGLAQA